MKIGLFIPCYINQFYPNVGKAAFHLLTKLGCDIDYPAQQTCCGQLMGNSGHEKDSKRSAKHFVKTFSAFDYIVGPTGSCVGYIRDNYDIIPQSNDVKHVRKNIYELTDFLINILKIEDFELEFPFKVGIHNSCHAHRHLGIGTPTELNVPQKPSYIELLLAKIKGIELVDLKHPDECCGFGGTFSVFEEAVSVQMGINRINDHKKNGAEVITGVDMSCLMHIQGILKRNNESIKVMHIAEILTNG